MVQTVRQALQNGLIFIEDIGGGKPPYPFTDEKVQHTPTCISVACLHEVDGEAELILGSSDSVNPGYRVSFDGELESPSKEIMISTVSNETLLKTKVPGVRTRIRVWRSHPVWPEQVVIGWDDDQGLSA